MLRILLLLVFLSACSKEAARSYLQDLFGENLANMIFGEVEAPKVVKEITLPPIPKVEKDATSTKSNIHEENINRKSIPYDKLRNSNIFFIRELYKEVEGVEVDQNSLSKWINVLDQGGSREGVYRALTNDVKFIKLMEKPEPLTNNSIEFVEYFSKTYLNLRFSKETLEKVNFHQLKSDLTDKTLEVMDAFSGRYNELYDWYAVLSEDLAKKYPLSFKFETRKNMDKAFHRKWAEIVPVQMVKSEVIIKLSQVLNSLNK